MTPLPIDPVLPEIVRALAEDHRLVLEAPPGAGKTTRVPRAMLDAGDLDGEIVVLEPRRLAARLAAKRVAEELNEPVGQTCGYQVRFEDVSSAKTRIRFVTEGILTRRLLSDPELRGVSAVVLDEFHERHLHGDVALALLRRLQRESRPDLRLVVMSATLDAEPVREFLQCRSIRAEGKRFDVAIEHAPAPDDRPLESQVASAVRSIVRRELDGHVLVFLPGAAEIRRARESCEAIAKEAGLVVVPLHGDLPPEEQDRAVRSSKERRVILATNVAESSVTIEGVVAVVDSGLARVASHAPWSGLPTLKLDKISRASAAQRAGRAGRTRPGVAIRLYTKPDHDARPEHDAPEIRRSDLAQTFLELRAARFTSIEWLEAPPEPSRRAADELLARLGAVDARGEVTAMGKRMLAFPLHPRIARVLAEAEKRGVADDASVLCAILSERDLRASSRARFDDRSHGHAATERSDLVALVDLFREAEDSRFSPSSLRAIGLDANAVRAVDRARKQLARITRRPDRTGDENDLLASVAAGYPDRVAKRKRAGSRDLAIAGGGIAELSEASVVRHAEWMIAVDAERRGSQTIVRLASGIEPDWLLDLFPDDVKETADVTWNASRERVESLTKVSYDGLTLYTSERGASAEEISRVLSEAALAAGPRAFAPPEALDRWLARARFAATVSDVPAPTPDAVRAALVASCAGKSSFAELREVSLLDLLKADLGSTACAKIERLAPERVSFDAGRAARIEYEDGKPPWVESYLQDFFGMVDTPKVGDGKTPLVLHLLAPNKRAVQVTSDLAGFWDRHYPTIKKELARKYPRHSWPDDPRQIAPRYRKQQR